MGPLSDSCAGLGSGDKKVAQAIDLSSPPWDFLGQGFSQSNFLQMTGAKQVTA